MKAVVDAVWAVWSIGASIYDYIHTTAMEERIHALENVITIHQCVIGLLSAGVLALFTYILFKKLWSCVKGGHGLKCGRWTSQSQTLELGILSTFDRLIRAGGYMYFSTEETVKERWDLTHTETLSLFRQVQHVDWDYLTVQYHLFPKSGLEVHVFTSVMCWLWRRWTCGATVQLLNKSQYRQFLYC